LAGKNDLLFGGRLGNGEVLKKGLEFYSLSKKRPRKTTFSSTGTVVKTCVQGDKKQEAALGSR